MINKHETLCLFVCENVMKTKSNLHRLVFHVNRAILCVYVLCFMFCDLHRLFFHDNHAAVADYAWLGVQAYFLLGNYISVFCLCCFSWRKTYKYICGNTFVLPFHFMFHILHFTLYLMLCHNSNFHTLAPLVLESSLPCLNRLN